MTKQSKSAATVAPALQVRRQSRLRRKRRRMAWFAGSIVLLIAAAWALYFSPFLAVSQVTIVGLHVATTDEVRAAAQIPLSEPLANLDAHAIAERVEKLPTVASCHVKRSWPNTVTLEIHERTLAYQVEEADSFAWVDETGAVFNSSPQAQHVPIAYLPNSDDQKLRSQVATAIDALSPDTKDHVQSVSASSADNILLQLADGKAIFWGSCDQSGDKAALLRVLLEQPGSTFDISSPSHPAVK